MKFLKYTLYITGGLAIIFFALGALTPSVTYESEVNVDKSIEEAWAVMNDESKMPEWIEGFKRAEHFRGTPNTIGSVSKIYVEENGEEMVIEETITALKPNEHIAMSFTMDFMKMDYEILMSEKEGKTHILTKSNSVGNGMFAKSILSLMPKAMKAQEDKNLNNLKKLIEENKKDYTGEAVSMN